jgi:ABC-type multidrug transport system ATPase subunit
MWDWIKSLRGKGKIIILTTHNIDEAEKVCDEVIILDTGRILEKGTPLDCRLKHVGKEFLELETETPLDVLKQALPDKVIKSTDNSSFYIKLQDLSESRDIIDQLNTKKVNYRRFSTKETTLEEVFIELTGRRIRD